jgi:hypothetical protein
LRGLRQSLVDGNWLLLGALMDHINVGEDQDKACSSAQEQLVIELLTSFSHVH